VTQLRKYWPHVPSLKNADAPTRMRDPVAERGVRWTRHSGATRDRAAGHRRKARLQIPVVLTPVGEQEVGPAQIVDDAVERAAVNRRHFGLEPCRPAS
jgi:hypothetical protein